MLPTEEGAELVGLVREIAQAELAPRAAEAEADERFPRDAFRLLGEAGVLGMPYPEAYGGLGQPYEVYLQALEEIAAAWMSVGVGVSVHVMTCYAMAELRHARISGDVPAGDDRRRAAGRRTRCPRRRPAPTSPR